MKKWLGRIRAMVVMGVTWALAWFGVGLILFLAVPFGNTDDPVPLLLGVLGFLAGTIFSAVLGIVEHRRRLIRMSLARFAGWGALGGLLLSGILAFLVGEFLVLGSVFALAGAGCAAGTLALARRGQERELLDANTAKYRSSR